MLTKLIIRNFKGLSDVEIALGHPVVFIGPNNSGKTTALQALALWSMGVKAWLARHGNTPSAKQRTGVTLNRRDLIALPIPNTNLLWKDLHVREAYKGDDGKQRTKNILIDVIVEGIDEEQPWSVGLEFDFANTESFYCRLRREDTEADINLPSHLNGLNIAFLPPMSGLASIEPKIEPGRINVLIGEGQTAQVLRNLCHSIYTKSDNHTEWDSVTDKIKELFGAELLPPEHDPTRGEITMKYRDTKSRVILDISSSGRGLQQTLLLLAYIKANPSSVLLLDEPDAHLEILRQRQVYNLISEMAEANKSQIISASHSEVVLNEAAGKGLVIAFTGTPHILNDKYQLQKSLQEIGFEQYLQAEEKGWVLYLEGPTDLSMLKALARKLGHTDAAEILSQPFVKYTGTNHPSPVDSHFFGLKDAKPDLRGIAIFDRIDGAYPQSRGGLHIHTWRKREIENYICNKETLINYARGKESLPLLHFAEAPTRQKAMEECIIDLEKAFETMGKGSPWSDDTKASDDVLTPLMINFQKKISAHTLRKRDFSYLVDFCPTSLLDHEIEEKLNSIVNVANNTTKARECSK